MLSKNMIFRNTLFGVAVCLAGALTACAEKELEVVGPADGGEQVEICFAPTVGADISTKGSDIQSLGETGLYLRTIISENKTNPFDEVATRATMVNGFDPDGAEGTYPTFTVYSFLHDGTWEKNSSNATPYINGINAESLGNGYWGFKESVFWPAWDTNMTFLSYAAPEGSDVDFSFTADDGEGGFVYATPTLVYSDPAVANDETHHGTITDENLAKQYDLLVAETPDVTKGTTNIPLSFSHVFAAVQFLCGDVSEGKISKLSLVNIAHKGVYDFGKGTWETDTNDRTEYVFDFGEEPVVVPGLKEDEELEEGQNMPSYDFPILSGESTLMMVPQDLTGSVLLIEYTSAVEGSTKVELAVELHGEWEAGAHITYHISFLSGDDDIIPDLSGQDGYFAEYVLANYDEDGNGHVSQEEADKVTELKIGYYPDEGQEPSQRIDFTGIEHFTYLKSFTSNYASALDVTQNAELTYICLNAEGTYMSGNTVMPAVPNVSTLDLSKNTKMTEIAENAFYNNTNLADVTLPESITKIGSSAFYGVSRDNEPRFESLVLPTAVEEIGESAFYGCSHLTTISLENVSTIGKYAFYNCSRLTEADLSKVTVINEHTFMDCKLMTDVTLSENLTAIGEYAFYSCDTLSINLVIPNGVETVGEYAFYDCHYLHSVEISEGVKVLDDYSFYRCGADYVGTTTVPAVAKVTLPSTLTKIGEHAFGVLGVIESGTTEDHDAFYTEFVVPEAGFPALESIGAYAFAHCDGLTTFPVSVVDIEKAGTGDLQMPTSATGALTTIGERAFYDCAALTSVTLPSTIATLGNYAFYGCSALGAFVCESENPPSTSWTDDPNRDYTLEFGADPKPVLYVYKSYKPNYTSESSGYWTTGTSGKFREIINIDAADDPVDESENNYQKFLNGTLKIGTKTVSTDAYGSYTVNQITEDTTHEGGTKTSTNGLWFIDSDATLTIKSTSDVYQKVIFVGNDFGKRSKVVLNKAISCNQDTTDVKYHVELMFYNVDVEIGDNCIVSFYDQKSTRGPVDYLAFDNCHITAKNSTVVVDAASLKSATNTYFDEIYIGDCVWELPASTSTTKLFNFDDSITSSPTKVTVKNNVFYCDGSDSLVPDFRFMTANGLTIGTFDYENNTLVNLGTSSTAGLVEYYSIDEATVTKNLTYVASPSSDYVFFHGASLPSTTTNVADNIAYLGDGTYTWYWLYNGTSTSNTGLENACTVLTSSPFDTLDVSTETFTVNSEYSGYGYQASTTEP